MALNISELAGVVKSLAAQNLAESPLSQRLGALAQVLGELAGVAGAAIYATPIPRGATQPRLDAPVFVTASKGYERPAPPRASALEFFGAAAVLGDTRGAVSRVVPGPYTDDPFLDADHDCLLLRVRAPHLLLWVCLYVEKTAGRTARTSDWEDALRLLVMQLDPDPQRPQARRRRFFQELVSYAPSKPAADFQHVCRVWQEVCDADWCWLWLFNHLDPRQTYELTSAWWRPGIPQLIPDRHQPGKGAVGHYACACERPTYVESVSAWSGTWNGVEHRVMMAKFFEAAQARSLLCVPLYEPGQPARQPLTSCVSLHYRDGHDRPHHDDEILLVMGRLTARFMAQSEEHEQHDILVELNRIAQRYLAEPAMRPSDARPRYVGELINLIQERLGVRYVSVFYRAGFDDAVECIGTTGLREVSSGKAVSPAVVKYAAGERNTGRCYAESIPILGRDEDVDHKYSERPKTEPGAPREPSAYIPIPDPLAQRSGRALGVIRCFARAAPLFRDNHASFDRSQVSTLTFVAEQVAPVLKTFEHRILRERTISAIKHDLSSPLTMMRDAVAELIEDHERGNPLHATHLYDLRATIKLASNLVSQLDPDPGAFGDYQPRFTYLEGEIVARLVDMLRSAAQERRMKIRFDGFRQVPALIIDPALIERAFYNLILNAIKYGEPNSEIAILASPLPDERGYIVDISNEGAGVEASDEALIFAAGFRSAQAQRKAVGAGLGLFIARRAMQRHGGELMLHRRKHPTTFRLFFPSRLRAAE